ncbi:MAG: NADH-quinone oxidoreductase subunit A [Thermoplasmata archaeon]
MLPEDYLAVALFGIVAIVAPPLVYLINRWFRPGRTLPHTEDTYECGEDPIGIAQVRFNFQYYLFAIVFVAFDVIAVVLLLWALNLADFHGSEPLLWSMAFVLTFALLLGGAAFYALVRQERVQV